VRVYYEDTDAGGVVYYANYLKYMERARTEWLASLGYELSSLERVEGIVFVVHRVEIDYRIPARLGERVDVTATLVELNRASMLIEQDVLRGDEALTHARVALACLAREGWRPVRMPAPLHQRLERLP
jgi:tol-pal system-associated acyl-CoA thioesterase